MATAQTTCGAIGKKSERELDDEISRRFFLNTLDPAPCTGYVTSWRICYYGPDDNWDANDRVSFWATFAVYREHVLNPQNIFYTRVSQTFRAVRTNRGLREVDSAGIRVDDGSVRYDEFSCYTDTMDGPPLLVQAGDIVGACIFRPDDGNSFRRRQLDVVGEAESEREFLLEMSASECTDNFIPGTISASDLRQRRTRRLHIYANIGMII